MEQKLITIFGGSGFIGSYIVKELAKTGASIQIVSRDPQAALPLKPAGPLGQIILTQGNIHNEQSLQQIVQGSFAVINATGILYETGKQRFAAIHAQGPEQLAKAAFAAGVERFIHFSALGVENNSKSYYARSKAAGEKAVLAAFPNATLLRPSIVFGAEDNFCNKFAAMAVISPVLPLISGGKTQFQPVYVDDIARAVRVILEKPFTMGKIIELAGPRIYNFRQLLELILETIGRKRLLVPLPTTIATLMASLLELLPSPALTRDQIRMLSRHNVLSAKEGILTLCELGIEKHTLETILPTYLARYRR